MYLSSQHAWEVGKKYYPVLWMEKQGVERMKDAHTVQWEPVPEE